MNCNEDLKLAGKVYPRTCETCGLGPCKNKELTFTKVKEIMKNLVVFDNEEGKCVEIYWSKGETLTGIHIPGCGGDARVFVNEKGKIRGIMFPK